MTAKEFLSQARGMKVRIEALEERRARYRDLATRRTAHYHSEPGGGTRRVSSVEEYALKIVDLDAELAARIEQYVDTLRKIEAVIDAVDDQRCRDLLKFRYLNGWSWNKVARRMDYSVDHVWHLHDRALKMVRVP